MLIDQVTGVLQASSASPTYSDQEISGSDELEEEDPNLEELDDGMTMEKV